MTSVERMRILNEALVTINLKIDNYAYVGDFDKVNYFLGVQNEILEFMAVEKHMTQHEFHLEYLNKLLVS